MRTIPAALALFMISCGAREASPPPVPPAKTRTDGSWFVAECPGHPDACVAAAEQHCKGDYSLAIADAAEASIYISQPTGTPYARREAEAGRLRLRCVVSVIAEDP